MSAFGPQNLYQRILDTARARRFERDDRLSRQINRIEDKAHGNQPAQEQRQGEEGNPEARRISEL